MKEKDSIADSENYVEIDINTILTPASILLGSVIIALAIVYGPMINGTGQANDQVLGAADQPQQAPEELKPENLPLTETSIDDDPVLGSRENAKIAIVEFSDYECPFCKRHFTNTFEQIYENYVKDGDVMIVFRDFPLSFHNPIATEEALAANCARDQKGDEGYWIMHEAIFNTTQSNVGLEKSQLYDLASELGFDQTKFTECLDKETFLEEITLDIEAATKAGVSGTPTFVIGPVDESGNVEGVIFSGAQDYTFFEQVIEIQKDRVK